MRTQGACAGFLGYTGTTSNRRDGDGKTPKDVFWMRQGFGTSKDPGLKPQRWTKVTGKHVWIDDSKSTHHNTMRTSGRSEKLNNTGSYKYAQVISYNEKRTPKKGSAVVLQRNTGKNTAGCVSMYEASLVKGLRWEKSKDVQIAIH